FCAVCSSSSRTNTSAPGPQHKPLCQIKMRTFLLVITIAAMVAADGAHHGDHAHGAHDHGGHEHGEHGHGEHAHEDHGGKELGTVVAAPTSSYDTPVPAPALAPAPASSYDTPAAPVHTLVSSYDTPAAPSHHTPAAPSYHAPPSPSYTTPGTSYGSHSGGSDAGVYYYYYPVKEETGVKKDKEYDGKLKGIDVKTIVIIVLVIVGILFLGTGIIAGRSFSPDPISELKQAFNLSNNDLLYYSNLVYGALAKEY
ncbi:unnamed protein product, partial [Meganyctiphanes norvegica]